LLVDRADFRREARAVLGLMERVADGRVDLLREDPAGLLPAEVGLPVWVIRYSEPLDTRSTTLRSWARRSSLAKRSSKSSKSWTKRSQKKKPNRPHPKRLMLRIEPEAVRDYSLVELQSSCRYSQPQPRSTPMPDAENGPAPTRSGPIRTRPVG
jgi:hypothetical protein